MEEGHIFPHHDDVRGNPNANPKYDLTVVFWESSMALYTQVEEGTHTHGQ